MNGLSHMLVAPSTERQLNTWKGLLVGLVGIAFILLYVVDYTFDNMGTDLAVVFAALLALYAVAVLLVWKDPLEKRGGGGGTRHSAFFEAQFPRVYIQHKHDMSASEARERWLGVLRDWRRDDHPDHLYYVTSLKSRLACRAVCFLERLLIAGVALSLVALAVLACLTWLAGIDATSTYSLGSPGLTAVRAAFPVLLLATYVYVRLAHRPDPHRPTGVWLNWKEINDMLKAWWDRNEAPRIEKR